MKLNSWTGNQVRRIREMRLQNNTYDQKTIVETYEIKYNLIFAGGLGMNVAKKRNNLPESDDDTLALIPLCARKNLGEDG